MNSDLDQKLDQFHHCSQNEGSYTGNHYLSNHISSNLSGSSIGISLHCSRKDRIFVLRAGRARLYCSLTQYISYISYTCYTCYLGTYYTVKFILLFQQVHACAGIMEVHFVTLPVFPATRNLFPISHL